MVLAIIGVVFGVLVIIGGINCLTSPLLTVEAFSMAIPRFAAVLLTVTSVFNFIQWINEKQDGEKNPVLFWEAVLGFAAGLILMSSFVVQWAVSEALLNLMAFLVPALVLASGMIHVVNAIRLRKLEKTIPMLGRTRIAWGWELALGILMIVVGLSGLSNPFTTLVAVGISIGMDLITYGIMLIAVSVAFN